MKIAVTGATGFIGHYIVRYLIEQGHSCICWYRPQSDRRSLEQFADSIQWIEGDLSDPQSPARLVESADAVVHGALHRPGTGFRGAEGNLIEFVNHNVVGSLRLIEAARRARVPRFVFISTCAVHEVILEDRKLDETHPLWATSHYGAHKAAVEKFVHSYGLGQGYNICALRPTGVYGLHQVPSQSRWYRLVKDVAKGKLSGVTDRGGKEVHAIDVARAVGILLQADGIAGQAYNCCDMYVSEQDLAEMAARLSNQEVVIERTDKGPKHQIDTTKIRSLGMMFGGRELLERTIVQLLEA